MTDMFPADKGITFQYRINLAKFAEQFVDIIIPFHGQYDKVATLIHSLLYHTRSNRFRICLVDDASPNSTFIAGSFSKIPNLKEVRNESQLGFGASLEAGVRAMETEKPFPWLVFMHSDCVIRDSNWLLHLGQSMLELKGQGVKMISAMSNNPTSELPALQSDEPLVIENEQDENYILAPTEYLPLYCVLCHKDLFKHIGGFVKHYPFAGYEDRELAARMQCHGFKQAVCRKSWIYHEGGATKKAVQRKNPAARDYLKSNRKLYLEDLQNYVNR